ncbi:MAG: hypothetical protein ACI9OI_001958, partial [Chitinophagales bacterium]
KCFFRLDGWFLANNSGAIWLKFWDQRFMFKFIGTLGGSNGVCDSENG